MYMLPIDETITRLPAKTLICETEVSRWHLTSLFQCPCCLKTVCQGCFRSCPGCGFGVGKDRRQEERYVL